MSQVQFFPADDGQRNSCTGLDNSVFGTKLCIYNVHVYSKGSLVVQNLLVVIPDSLTTVFEYSHVNSSDGLESHSVPCVSL